MNVYGPVQTSLQKAIKDSLQKIGYLPSDCLVIPSDQNGLEPTNTYCSMHIMNIKREGRVNEASFILNEGDILETVAHYNIYVQLSFIGKRSPEIGPDYWHNFTNNRVCFEVLQRANFGILKVSDIRRVPQKRDTQFVECFNMDVNLSFAIKTRQAYDWVEYIVVNGETIRIWNQ